MSATTKVLLAVFAGFILLGLLFGDWICSGYNTLVSQDEGVKQAWSQVQNQYQRRADLVPNLVATVQGAANFERQTLTAVIEARAKATQMQVNAEGLLNNPQMFQQFQQAQDNLGAALGRLMVVVERYPELKANQNFRSLQDQLEGTENRIAVARKDFNLTVQAYNTSRRGFPRNILAGMFNFQMRPYFEAASEAQQTPKVDFSPTK